MRAHTLPESRRASVAEHLAECATCREFLARVEYPKRDPERIGRYVIKRRIGAGGMGVVYEAMDPHLDRRVAIKVVRPEQLDDDGRRRLLREARALAKISHPNVVTVHDVGEHDHQVFVATEFVDGETMATWQVGRDWRVLIGAWIQVARGLAAAHAGGIVHRDVKPSNVFVGRDGRVRIGDFGVARGHAGEATEPSTGHVVGIGPLTVTGAVAGTPGYMAPEQLRGAVDARSDQFALCVAVIEGLTGARPEAGTAPPLAGLPGALRDALIRGLAVDPDARFTTMAELADAFAGALGASASPPVRRRPWSAIMVAVAFAGAVFTVAIMVALNSPPGPQEYAIAATRGREVVAKVVPPDRADDAVAPTVPADRSPPAPDAISPDPQLPPRRGYRPSIHGSRDRIDERSAGELLKQAKALDAVAKWDEARAVYQRLEGVKGYVSEALYREAWAAFQSNDVVGAAQLALQAASTPGPFQMQAKFLYGDALYRQGEYRRAKEYYLTLRSKVRGDDRATATKKVMACNRALGQPDASGLDD